MADLSAWAPEIDLGEASAGLSALLGGYRASADGAYLYCRLRSVSSLRREVLKPLWLNADVAFGW